LRGSGGKKRRPFRAQKKNKNPVDPVKKKGLMEATRMNGGDAIYNEKGKCPQHGPTYTKLKGKILMREKGKSMSRS